MPNTVTLVPIDEEYEDNEEKSITLVPVDAADISEDDSILGRVADTGIDLAKGAVTLGQSAVGLADMATGNLVGKGLSAIGYNPKGTINILESGYSGARKQANANVQDATGFWDTVDALIDNPSVAFGSIMESAPLSLAGAGIVRATAAKMLGTELAKRGIAAGSTQAAAFAKQLFQNKAVVGKLIAIGAGAEGAQSAGISQEDQRAQGKGWAESLPYAAGAGLGTAAIGVASSKVPGFRDAEAMMGTAGYEAKKSLWNAGKEVAKTMFKEGALEELPQEMQETIWENLALERPWDQGVAKAGAMGMVVGAAQGGGMAAASELMNSGNEESEPTQTPPPTQNANQQQETTLLTQIEDALYDGKITPEEVRKAAPGIQGVQAEQIEAVLQAFEQEKSAQESAQSKKSVDLLKRGLGREENKEDDVPDFTVPEDIGNGEVTLTPVAEETQVTEEQTPVIAEAQQPVRPVVTEQAQEVVPAVQSPAPIQVVKETPVPVTEALQPNQIPAPIQTVPVQAAPAPIQGTPVINQPDNVFALMPDDVLNHMADNKVGGAMLEQKRRQNIQQKSPQTAIETATKDVVLQEAPVSANNLPTGTANVPSPEQIVQPRESSQEIAEKPVDKGLAEVPFKSLDEYLKAKGFSSDEIPHGEIKPEWEGYPIVKAIREYEKLTGEKYVPRTKETAQPDEAKVEKPLNKIVSDFYDMCTKEHNERIAALKAEKKIVEIAEENRKYSDIQKMGKMRLYNETALNSVDGLAKLPQWLQDEFAEYRASAAMPVAENALATGEESAENSDQVNKEIKRQLIEYKAELINRLASLAKEKAVAKNPRDANRVERLISATETELDRYLREKTLPQERIDSINLLYANKTASTSGEVTVGEFLQAGEVDHIPNVGTPMPTEATEARPKFITDAEGKIARVIKWEGDSPVIVYPGNEGGKRAGAAPFEYILSGKWAPATAEDFHKVIRPSGSERMNYLRAWRDEFAADVQSQSLQKVAGAISEERKAGRKAVIENRLRQGLPVSEKMMAEFPELIQDRPVPGKPITEPAEIFIRPAERKDLGKTNTKLLREIPDKEGYEKVYKPYGAQGRGFYYVKPKEKAIKVNRPPEPKEGGAQNLVTFLQKAGKVRLGEDFTNRTGTAWDRAHGKKGKDQSRELGIISQVASKNGKLAMDEAADLLNAEGFINTDGQPFTSDTLFELLAYGKARSILHPENGEGIMNKQIEEKENEWIERQLADLEAEGIDAGAISESQESLEGVSVSEIAEEESLSEEEIAAAYNDAADFFTFVAAVTKEQSTPAEEPAKKETTKGNALTAEQAVKQYKDAQIVESNKNNRAGSWDLSAIGNYADRILKPYLSALEKNPFKSENYYKKFLFRNSKDNIVGSARAKAKSAGLLDVAYDKEGNPFYALQGTSIPKGLYSEAHVMALDKKYNGWENIPSDAWDKPVKESVKVNVEKAQSEIPGTSERETFGLINPETDMSKHVPLSEQKPQKNEDMFAEREEIKPPAGAYEANIGMIKSFSENIKNIPTKEEYKTAWKVTREDEGSSHMATASDIFRNLLFAKNTESFPDKQEQIVVKKIRAAIKPEVKKEPREMTANEYAAEKQQAYLTKMDRPIAARVVDGVGVNAAKQLSRVVEAKLPNTGTPEQVTPKNDDLLGEPAQGKERLPGETIPDWLDRLIGKKTTPEDIKANKLRAAAERLTNEAHSSLSGMEPGQPIINRADRNRRERAREKIKKAAELIKKAEERNSKFSLKGQERPIHGIPVLRIQSIVNKVMSALNINPKINIIQHVSECPTAILADMKKNGILDENGDSDVQGFAWKGETWLVADNLDSGKDAFKVLMHELTHNGLGALLKGDASIKPAKSILPVKWQYDNLMDKIIAGHRRDIMTIARTTHTHLNLNTLEGRRAAAEEWLCNQSYESQAKWYDKLVAIFNNLVRSLGLDVKLSDAEVRTILQQAFQTFDGRKDVRYMVGAWHGSRELFEQFSSQKVVKTGSFGHGLYFSSMKEVAEQYKEGGHLYRVALKPDETDFLDWDAPVNEQSRHVQDVLSNSAIREALDAYEDAGGYVDTGRDVYFAIMKEQGSAQAASQLLSDYGIAGNKYLDLSQEKGADNYVLFDDRNVDIEARYARKGVENSRWWEGRDWQKEINNLPLKNGAKARNFEAEGYVPITRKEADYLWQNNMGGFVSRVDIRGAADTPGNEGIFMKPLSYQGYEGLNYDKTKRENTEAREFYQEYKDRYLRGKSGNLDAEEGRRAGTLREEPEQEGLKSAGVSDNMPSVTKNKGTASGIPAQDKPQVEKTHRPVKPEYGSPLNDLTNSFSDDIYSKNALEYFGEGNSYDKQSINIIKSLRGNPEADVKIYRAVDKGVKDFNEGDWVTINKNYAIDHGEGILDGNYDIIEKTVKAKDLISSGDSIHEFGYFPSETTPLAEAGIKVYHATAKDFTSFDLNEAKKITEEGYDAHWFWLEKNRADKYLKDRELYGYRGDAPKVISTTIKPEAKIFNSSTKKGKKEYNDILKTLQLDEETSDILPQLSRERNPIDLPYVGDYPNYLIDELKKRGYDGSYFDEGNGIKTLAIWNEKVIRQLPNPSRPLEVGGQSVKDQTKATQIRELSTEDAKYSIRAKDKAYLKAVESGDMETAQKMVDDAARGNGYTEKVYHGGRQFNKFDARQNGTGSGVKSAYFWFTSSEENAESFKDGEIKSLWLNPREVREVQLQKGESPATAFDRVAMEAYNNDEEMPSAFVARNVVDGRIHSDIYGITPNDDGTTTEVKSSAPAVYDDNGDVVPLSERFNNVSADIRYSVRDRLEELDKSGYPILAETPAAKALLKKLKSLYNDTGKIDEGKTLKALEQYEKVTNVLRDDKADIYAKQKALETHIKENLPPAERFRVMHTIKSIAKNATEKGREAALDRAIQKVNEAHGRVAKSNLITKINKMLYAKRQKTTPQGVQDNRSLDVKTNKLLGVVRRVVLLDKEAGFQRAANILEKMDNGTELTKEELNELIILQTFSGIRDRSFKDIKKAEEMLGEIVSNGRAGWEFQEDRRKEKMTALREQFIEEVTGGKGLKTLERERLESGKGAWQRFKDGARSIDDMFQSWEMLLDKLSRFDKNSRALESPTTDHYRRLVLAATTTEHAGIAAHQELIKQKLIEIFGKKKLAKTLFNNTKIQEITGVTRATTEGRIEIPLSQNQAYKLLQMFQQPSIQLEMEGHGYDDLTLRELEKFIDPKVKQWAQWQIEEFFPKYRDGINDIYKQLFYIDMPNVENYSPISRVYTNETTDEALLRESGKMMSSVLASAVKTRTENARDFNIIDGDSVLFKHIVEMEHFKAWGVPMKELRSVFGNEGAQRAVKQYHGYTANRVLQNFINRFASGGQERALTIAFMDKMRANFTKAVLGVNPVVFLKQLSSLPAYAMEVPTTQFIKGTAYALTHPITVYKTLMKSPAMPSRYKIGWERDVMLAMRQASIRGISKRHSFTDMLMLPIELGDKFAVIAGGWSVYKYHLDRSIKAGMNKEAAEKEAMYQFDVATKRSQQAGDVMDLSYWQSAGGSWGKWFTMFMTAPLGYYRNSAAAIRNIIAGRKGGNVKRLVVSWVVLQMIFQWVAQGGEGDDDDEQLQILRAAIVGPLNGIPIIKDFVEPVAEALISGQAPFFNTGALSPMTTATVFARAAKDAHDWIEKDFDEEEFLQMADRLATATGQMTGVPYAPVARLAKGIYSAVEGETDTPIRTAIGYSDYSLGKK